MFFTIWATGKPMGTILFSSFSSLQSISRVRLFETPWIAAHQASLSITNSQFTQIHVLWVGGAIQPSHSLLPPSPAAFNLSQHQGLFKWVSSSHQVAKVLELQPQHQSFQWIFMISFRMDRHLCKYESCKYTPACWADLTQWSPHKCPVMLDLLVENQQTLETAN